MGARRKYQVQFPIDLSDPLDQYLSCRHFWRFCFQSLLPRPHRFHVDSNSDLHPWQGNQSNPENEWIFLYKCLQSWVHRIIELRFIITQNDQSMCFSEFLFFFACSFIFGAFFSRFLCAGKSSCIGNPCTMFSTSWSQTSSCCWAMLLGTGQGIYIYIEMHHDAPSMFQFNW